MQEPQKSQMRDYYAVLGIPRTATDDDIKKAFKRRALQTHPDKHPGKPTAEFRAVKLAYSVLSDSMERSKYDRENPTAGTKTSIPVVPPRRSSFDNGKKPLSLMYKGEAKSQTAFDYSSWFGSTGEYDVLRKFVFVGAEGVRKADVVREFTKNPFTEGAKSTIGSDFGIKTIEHNGQKVKLQLWDTAGQERFRKMTTSYYRGAHGFVAVIDAAKERTLFEAKRLIERVREKMGEDAIVALVITNCHGHTRVMDSETIREFCEQNNICTRSEVDVDSYQDVIAKMTSLFGVMIDAVEKKENADILKEDRMLESGQPVLQLEGGNNNNDTGILAKIKGLFK